MSLTLKLNGQDRIFESLTTPTTLNQVMIELGLKPDRVAIEHNGEIAPRTSWTEAAVQTGDRLEVVHFVGGGDASFECNVR